jgi:beta-lactamase regulating signal transducer with metallopeptidase domain
MISSADLIPFANHLWQSTVFVLAVWLVTLALQKNRAALRHRLWLAASIKFLIPFSALVSLGARIPMSTSSVTVPTQVSAAVNTISVPFAASYATPAYFVPDEPVASLPPQQSRIPAILVSIWLFGFVGSLLWWSLRWRQIWRAVQQGTPLGLGIPRLPVRLIEHGKMEPGVFGVFRPVLLLPKGITERLSADELQSVIAHELCHVRRRDNMTSAIHMFIEALFWFHPLIWWIKARLLEEQERACDEEVLSRGGNPQVYAESILKICKLYLNPPLACVSRIAGSNLQNRIEAIMRCRMGVRLDLGRAILLTLASVMALVVPITAGAVQAREGQSVTERTIAEFLQLSALRALEAPVGVAQTQIPLEGGRAAGQQSVGERPMPVARTVQPAIVIHGTWEIENPSLAGPSRSPAPGRFQLTLDGRTGKSFALDSSLFRGLTSAEIGSRVRTTAHFEIDAEAGRFVCEGNFEAGFGKGTYLFYPDVGFLGQMGALGFSGIQEQELVSMALHGAGPGFLRELRSAGITNVTFDQLMGMRAVGVTGDYIRQIQEAGYSPNPDELISMWVHEVTPEFATKSRQLYPTASPNDLIGMQVNGVTPNVGRQAQQSNPSAFSRSSSPGSPVLPGTWTIQAGRGRNAAPPDSIQLTFFSPGGGVQSSTVPFGPSVFRGLTSAQLMSRTPTTVRFDIVRDAGTLVCEGNFQDGRGSGTSVFQPNPDYRAQLLTLGVQDIDDRWLVAMALHDLSLQFVLDLRDAGIGPARGSQLLNLRIQNVTPDFVRDIRRVYPSASINQLMDMRVQNVTPDLVNEIRQLYPSASINDLINMRVQNVTPQFARERQQMNPSISIRDLVQAKVQTR